MALTWALERSPIPSNESDIATVTMTEYSFKNIDLKSIFLLAKSHI